MKMAWPRQLTLTTAPGSSLLMSCSTGAPNACARALGFQEARNGTAVNAAPATPVTVVATSRKWRRPPSTFSTSDVIQDLREASFARAPHTGACEPGARFQTFKEFRIIHTSLTYITHAHCQARQHAPRSLSGT